MPDVAALDLEPAFVNRVRDAGAGLSCSEFHDSAAFIMDDQLKADTCAVLVGASLVDPLPLLTSLGRQDRDMPVVVLRKSHDLRDLKTRLRFAPGIGRQIRIWDEAEFDDIIPMIHAFATRKSTQAALSRGLAAAASQPSIGKADYELDEVLSNAPIGIAVLNPQGEILAINRSSESLLGWSRSRVRDRKLAERFNAEQRLVMEEMIAACLKGDAISGPHRFELRHVVRGEPMIVQVSAGRIGEIGAVSGCAVYLDDITDLAEAQNEVEAARARLEDKVAARTRAMSAIKARLEQRGAELERSNDELKQAKAELEQLTVRDGLTGLYNRRYLDLRLSEESSRMQRMNSPLAVLMIDIDHFKAYNDTLGHVEGDVCLTQVAQVISAACRRSGEFAARYGGEEFSVVLPGSTADEALVAAQRIIEQLAELDIPHPTASHVTVSIGIESATGPGMPAPGELIRRADKALYASKQAGRNRATVYSAG